MISPPRDDAAADPGADERSNDVAIASPNPKPKLGCAGDPHVVTHLHGTAQRRPSTRP